MIDTHDEDLQALALAEVLNLCYKPAVIADVGCNSGLYLEPFQKQGCTVQGFDIEAYPNTKVPIKQIDITAVDTLDFPADLTLCLEVLEHIPEEKADAALKSLTSTSDKIIFSAAQPGQGGVGHINCQPKSYWLEKFSKLGFSLREDETAHILDQLKGRPGIMGWLFNNLMVFQRSKTVSAFKKRMRFHVVNLPHTQTTKEYLPCAYTQKVVNFCRMMKSLGHEVYLYASEDNDAPCDELITCITKDQQRKTFPPNNWKKDFFAIEWNSVLPYWRLMNNTAISEIGKRIQQKDFICLIGGNCQQPIAGAFPNHIAVEFGIGYEGTFSKYRVFESYAWMHYIYGKTNQNDGSYYDAVIPNYYDPADFQVADKRGNYFLFIGRLISRKGPHIAAEICRSIGAKLIVAGQGLISQKPGEIVGDGITLQGDLKHVGTVNVQERNLLMSKAKAVIVQTQYIGPFEGVHVEAMMCGTPVITTDWGCFSETVIDGKTGYRTRTLGEGVWAVQNLGKLLPAQRIRDYAVKRYSIDSVRFLYQSYFLQLMDLWGKGWYSTADDHCNYTPETKRDFGCFV